VLNRRPLAPAVASSCFALKELSEQPASLRKFLGIKAHTKVRFETGKAVYKEKAINDEFESLAATAKAHGTPEQQAEAEEALECLKYVTEGKAGESPLLFCNGDAPPCKRDEGRNGETLDDFLRCREAQEADLDRHHGEPSPCTCTLILHSASDRLAFIAQ